MKTTNNEELKNKLLIAINDKAPEYKNLTYLDSEDIKQVLAIFFNENILSINYEEIESVNEVYFMVSYYSEKLRKTIILDNDAPNSFSGTNCIENLINYILDYEAEAETLENSIKIIDKEKPLAEELARITLELTAQPMSEPMDGDATQDLSNDFLIALDDLMGNA